MIGREHSAVNDLTIGQRHYPMLIEHGPGGRWWVAQAADFSQAHSDLVIYDSDKGAVKVLALSDMENAPLETPGVTGVHWLVRNPGLGWMLKWYDRVFYWKTVVK